MNQRCLLFACLLVFHVASSSAADKKLLMLAGKPSHGPAEHEYRAGCLLLQKCLAGGVRFSRVGPDRFRAVMHLDIHKEDVEKAFAVVRDEAA